MEIKNSHKTATSDEILNNSDRLAMKFISMFLLDGQALIYLTPLKVDYRKKLLNKTEN